MFMTLPVYWRFLTKTFLKLFGVCTLCTFALGIVAYNGQFAFFFAAGASVTQVLTLAACSLFRVFSLIIGVTTLFSTFFTTYQLSITSEIISLRTSGLSLPRILAPIYYATAFITVANFTSTNLLAPYLRRMEANVIAENKTINPLILLRKEALPQSSKLHIEMDLLEGGTVATEVLVAYHNQDGNGISILTADKLMYNSENISGENASLITHLKTPIDGFNHLLIANQKKFNSSNSLLTPMFNSKSKKRELSIKATPTVDLLNRKTFGARKELLERGSTSLIPLSFAFIGISLGLFHPRQLEERRWYFLIGSILLFFSSFFQAQQLHALLPLVAILFYLPHVILLSCAYYLQKIYQRGGT